MSHTYSSNLVHCVFSTKNRADLISDQVREPLYAYVFGTGKNLGMNILAIGGIANHVHLLIALPPTQTLSDAIRGLKANSSRWMKQSRKDFGWQEGFGAFSVSPSQVPSVKEYIRNQAEHHRRRNFEEEFVAMLRKSGIDYDPKWVFG